MTAEQLYEVRKKALEALEELFPHGKPDEVDKVVRRLGTLVSEYEWGGKPKECPFCPDGMAKLCGCSEGYIVWYRCHSCGARTRDFWHQSDALAAWNQRREG